MRFYQKNRTVFICKFVVIAGIYPICHSRDNQMKIWIRVWWFKIRINWRFFSRINWPALLSDLERQFKWRTGDINHSRWGKDCCFMVLSIGSGSIWTYKCVFITRNPSSYTIFWALIPGCWFFIFFRALGDHTISMAWNNLIFLSTVSFSFYYYVGLNNLSHYNACGLKINNQYY